jgi:hypothetical protein
MCDSGMFYLMFEALLFSKTEENTVPLLDQTCEAVCLKISKI